MAINSGLLSDAQGDPVSLATSVGSITNNNDSTWSWGLLKGDGPVESQTVVITAHDRNDGSAETAFTLTQNNMAPVVGTITAPTDPVLLNAEVSTSALFSDVGVLDSHTAVWD